MSVLNHGGPQFRRAAGNSAACRQDRPAGNAHDIPDFRVVLKEDAHFTPSVPGQIMLVEVQPRADVSAGCATQRLSASYIARIPARTKSRAVEYARSQRLHIPPEPPHG